MNRVIVVGLCLIGASYAQRAHDFMTDGEIYSVFQVPRHKVPPYEIVPIRHSIHKRDADSDSIVEKITIKTKNKDLEINLDPSDGILAGTHTPVYLAKPNADAPNGVEYTQVEDALKDIRVYQSQAAIFGLTFNRYRNVDVLDNANGLINNSTIIRNFPARLRSDTNFMRSVLGFDSSDNPHIIFKSPDIEGTFDTAFLNRVRRSLDNNDISDVPSTVPDVVYPQILLVMDYNLFKTQGENVGHALLYLLSFWNAVDLRYRSMKNPEVRLNIAGIVISTEEGGAPFLEDHILNSVDEWSTAIKVKQLDADKSLESMSKFFYKEDRLPEHDLAVAMTRLDLCNMLESPFFNDFCDGTTIGYAYEFGACNRSSIDQNTEAVAIVEDNGGYSGIIPATHELAHLFGVSHDEGDCAKGGYIMSEQLGHSLNSFEWSSCTQDAFRQFFSSPDAQCLLNKPTADRPVERILPGEVQSLDEQCMKAYGTRACQKEGGNPCALLQCQVPGKSFCRGLAAAAEGSDCGDDKHCIRGQCVPVGV